MRSRKVPMVTHLGWPSSSKGLTQTSLILVGILVSPALARPSARRKRAGSPGTAIRDRAHKDYHVWTDQEDRAYPSVPRGTSTWLSRLRKMNTSSTAHDGIGARAILMEKIIATRGTRLVIGQAAMPRHRSAGLTAPTTVCWAREHTTAGAPRGSWRSVCSLVELRLFPAQRRRVSVRLALGFATGSSSVAI